MAGSSGTFFAGLDSTRDDIDKVVTYYNDTADGYNELLHNSGYTNTTDYCSDLLKNYLEECSDPEVFDVGCGSGKTGISLQKSGFKKIDGVDPATKMLDVSKKLGCYRNLVEGKLTDTENFSYEDGSFDGILCIGCFTVGHITLKNGIPEFIRILRKGGVAVYTVSFTLDKGVAMQEHAPFISDGKIELLRIEKKFYHFIDSTKMYCHIYAIKKL